MQRTFKQHLSKSRMVGKTMNQVYYPEKQLYGGFVERADQLQAEATVTQNALILDRAIVTESGYVFGDAVVRGSVVVRGNAFIGGNVLLDGQFTVGGNARIESANDFVVIGPIGSRNAYTVFHKMITPGMIGVSCGCYCGTLKEFTERVRRTYRVGHVYREQYDRAIEYARQVIKLPTL
jgi:hypothetical protein